MENQNKKRLEELKKVKTQIEGKNKEIVDISTYGEIDYTNDFIDNPENIYVVKEKTKERKIKTVFYAGKEKMGEVNEKGILVLEKAYKKKVDDAKFLRELNGANTYSLKTLEAMLAKETINVKEKQSNSIDTNEQTANSRKGQYDIEFDLDKKITQTEGLRDFIPEISKRDYQRVVAREESSKKYQLYGITKEGKEELIALEMIEGTNPNQDMISTDSKGNGDRRVEKEQAYSMLKFQGRPNEGISIRKGEMGIQEVDYWRRTPQDGYQNIPINLKSTNQKNVDRQIQRHLDKTKTNHTHLQKDIENAEELIGTKQKEIGFEKIHTQDSGKIEEFQSLGEKIKKEAEELDVPVELFLFIYNQTKGDTYQEKLQNTKERFKTQKEDSLERTK